MKASNKPVISELHVMKSNAGFYIGRSYTDESIPVPFPYSRESGYYRTKERAQKALNNNTYNR